MVDGSSNMMWCSLVSGHYSYVESDDYYLHQGGYVFARVCLSVCVLAR